MPQEPPDSRELGYYFALAQVGMEMVAPLLLGVYLDYVFDWQPWATVVGALLGFVGGLTHLVMMVQRHDKAGPSKPQGGAR
jgi:F0F1-type ATP synthase assembly protein I